MHAAATGPRALRLRAYQGTIGSVMSPTAPAPVPAVTGSPPAGRPGPESSHGPVRPGPAAALRRVAVPLGVLGGVAGAFAYVAAVDPNQPGHYPLCPLLYYTGVYCPGCGGLRSAHAIAHGHLGSALGCNALAVASYALFAVVWVVWCVRALRGRALRPNLGRAHWWAVWGLMIAFTIVRNLPFGAALTP